MLLPPRVQLSFLAAIIERIAFIQEPLWLRILRDRCCSEMVGLRLKFNPFPFFRFIDIVLMISPRVIVIDICVRRRDDENSETPLLRVYRVGVTITQFPHHFEWTEFGFFLN